MSQSQKYRRDRIHFPLLAFWVFIAQHFLTHFYFLQYCKSILNGVWSSRKLERKVQSNAYRNCIARLYSQSVVRVSVDPVLPPSTTYYSSNDLLFRPKLWFLVEPWAMAIAAALLAPLSFNRSIPKEKAFWNEQQRKIVVHKITGITSFHRNRSAKNITMTTVVTRTPIFYNCPWDYLLHPVATQGARGPL